MPDIEAGRESMDSDGTAQLHIPAAQAGPAARINPAVPSGSFAPQFTNDDPEKRTNKGNTKVVMTLLADMWIFSLIFILGGTYLMTFYLAKLQGYNNYEIWNTSCWWKLGTLNLHSLDIAHAVHPHVLFRLDSAIQNPALLVF